MRTDIFATSAEKIHTTQRRLNYFQQKMCQREWLWCQPRIH